MAHGKRHTEVTAGREVGDAVGPREPEDSAGKLWSSRNMRKGNVFWSFHNCAGGRCEALEPGSGCMVVNRTWDFEIQEP